MSEISKAVQTLCDALKEDKEYYITWQANIAMSVFDELEKSDPMPKCEERRLWLHSACNQGAKNFLDLLIL